MSTARQKRLLFMTAFPVVAALLGCGGGPTRPDDLPPLTACTLTVAYQGTPLADATVTLTPEAGKWLELAKRMRTGK